jgi:hypothetical protein
MASNGLDAENGFKVFLLDIRTFILATIE